jgi:uncharacterized membrane protein YphA (DoxX/SURF4 family)
MSKGLRAQTGYGFFVAVFRIMFGAIVLAAGTEHFLGGEFVFKFIVSISNSAIGNWVAANVAVMFPVVVATMWLTGLSLIFGFLARIGSLLLALFSVFFILGVYGSWIGDLAMLGVAIGLFFIGPGRYYGFDAYLVEEAPVFRYFA